MDFERLVKIGGCVVATCWLIAWALFVFFLVRLIAANL